eukprot:m.22113 g.22113  ORF g.22113 m.22113 type:complete len:55 (+) comp28285_c0_seq1:80-244(+)
MATISVSLLPIRQQPRLILRSIKRPSAPMADKDTRVPRNYRMWDEGSAGLSRMA